MNVKYSWSSKQWKLSFNENNELLLCYSNHCYIKTMSKTFSTGKNNGFPFLDILEYLKNTHKNPKFGKVRQVPTKFPDWDLSHSSKFGILGGIH